MSHHVSPLHHTTNSITNAALSEEKRKRRKIKFHPHKRCDDDHHKRKGGLEDAHPAGAARDRQESVIVVTGQFKSMLEILP